MEDLMFEEQGRARMHDVDPRMNREPAGSLLLARAGAINQAQQSAMRKLIGKLVAEGAVSPEAFDRVASALVARATELVEHREVVVDSLEPPYYAVTLRVTFDEAAVRRAIQEA